MRLDARHTPRLPVNAPAQLAFGAGRLDVLAEDLALGGCGLVAPLPLRRGQPVYLTLRLPGAPSFATHATVAWASSATPHRAGVEFGPDLSQDRERSVRAVLGVPRLASAAARGAPPHDVPPRGESRGRRTPHP